MGTLPAPKWFSNKTVSIIYCMALYKEKLPPASLSRPRLVEALRQFLPADAVLFEPEETRPYECDGLSAYRETPWVVVLPDDIDPQTLSRA